MKSLFAAIAACALLVAAGSAQAHHGGARIVVVDDFGNVRAVGGNVVVRGVHTGPVVVRGGNVNRFNQNGGVNRFGRRR